MQTTPNTITALLQWMVANLFLMGLTVVLWRSLRVGARRVDTLLCGFLFIYLITFVMMLFGFIGWLQRTPIFLISLLGCLGFAWARLKCSVRPHHFDSPDRGRFPRPLWLCFLFLVAIQLTRLAAHVWFLPPYVWDTLTYHLPNVAEWVQHHRLVTFDTPVIRSFWPANYELFQTWFVIFPHHDFLIDAASIPFYVLATASVYAIARSLDIGRMLACFVALLYAYTPSIAIHATTGNNDLPIAAVYLLTLTLLLDWQREGTHLSKRLMLIGMGLCLAIGTKPYIVFIAPGLVVVGLWSIAKRKPSTIKFEAPMPVICFVGLSGLALAGYWFMRNFILFDNPFYPTVFTLFGHPILGTGETHGQQGAVHFASLIKNVEMLVSKKIYDASSPYEETLADMTGWGWFAFVCGLPTLIYGIFTIASVRWLACGFLVSLAGLLGGVSPDPWNMRFTLWFPALFALSFGLVIHRLRIKAIRWAFYLFATVCTILNLIGTLGTGLSPGHWWKMAQLPLKARSTAALGLYIGPSYQNALKTIPPHETIGYHVHDNGWIYPLYGPDFSRKVRYIPIAPTTDIPEAMHQRNVRYLFVSRPRPPVARRIEETVKAGDLRRIGDGLYVRKD